MRLFDIAAEIESLLNASVNPETGEIEEAALAQLAELEMARDEKCLAVAAYAVGQEREAEAIEEQAKRLRARAAVHANHAARLRAYVAEHLPVGTKIADARVALSWRKSVAVEITDTDKLPAQFWRVRSEPAKSDVSEALKAGEEVAGAQLVTRHALVIK